MNTTEMIDRLSIRLEDSSNQAFSKATLLKTLNNAQIKLANMLHYNYLTELQVIETGVTSFTGSSAPYYKALSGLSYGVLRGAQGILAVKINGSSGPYCRRVDLRNLKHIENSYLGGSTANPIYYVLYNRIYVDNDSTTPTVDVYYLKTPATMVYTFEVSAHGTPSATQFLIDGSQYASTADDAYNGAVIYSTARAKYYVITDYDAVGVMPGTNDRAVTVVDWDSSGTNWGDDTIYFVTNRFDTLSIRPTTSDASMYVETCELNPSLHELVVSIAEAECWGIDNQPERRSLAEEIFKNEVGALNAKYVDASGIGTAENERMEARQ